MLKVVDLGDGKQLELRATAATPLIYKNQFGTDFFGDMLKLAKVFDNMQDVSDLSWEDLDKLDMTILYQAIYAFAKNADQSLGDITEWLSQFQSFPLEDIMGAVADLIKGLFTATKK